MKSTTGLILLPLVFVAASVMAGCSSGDPTVDMASEKPSLDKIQMVSKIFDAAGGDMSKVSPEDKAKLLKAFETQEKVNSIWKGLGTRGTGVSETHEKPK